VALTRHDDAVQLILQCAGNADRPYLVAATNTHLITLASRNGKYASTLEKFDFIVPDGMPLIWYLNFFEKADLSDRVYGPELMTRCLARQAGANSAISFLVPQMRCVNGYRKSLSRGFQH
jgi:N-acetylglucosaminyldiphosphoundecaprenol N-acetyl-beta-D-mannosaminyltransferase